LSQVEDTNTGGAPDTQGQVPVAPVPAESPRRSGWFSRGWHYVVSAAVLVIVAGAFFAIGWFTSPDKDHPDRARIEDARQHLYPRERDPNRGGAGQPNPYQWSRPHRQQQTPAFQEAYLGVGLATVTPELQQRYDLSTATGALVVSIDRTGPAFRAGIRRGDVITNIDGSPVSTQEDVVRAVTAKKPGDTVSIIVNRDSQSLTFQVTLGTRPAATGGAPVQRKAR